MLSRLYKIKICVLITKHLAPQNHRVPWYLSEPNLPVGCYIVLSYLLSTWYLSKYGLNISRTKMIEEKLISTPEMAAQNGPGDINFSGRVKFWVSRFLENRNHFFSTNFRTII